MGKMIVSSGYRKRGFDAYGGTILRKEDMSYWENSPKRTDPMGVAIGLGDDVELVESSFFETVPTISAIWMENPKCKLQMTDEVVKLLRANRVLLRGFYNSTAEEYARQYHLRFLLLDVPLASVGDYYERGIDIITLRFYEDGSPYIHQDCRCQGISAGSVGGGETSFDLPKDFYLTMTPKEIADKCWGSCYRELLDNGKLKATMAAAKKKGGFLLEFEG